MSEIRNIIELLQNEKYLVTEEICPFKRTKQVYKSTKNIKSTKNNALTARRFPRTGNSGAALQMKGSFV